MGVGHDGGDDGRVSRGHGGAEGSGPEEDEDG